MKVYRQIEAQPLEGDDGLDVRFRNLDRHVQAIFADPIPAEVDCPKERAQMLGASAKAFGDLFGELLAEREK